MIHAILSHPKARLLVIAGGLGMAAVIALALVGWLSAQTWALVVAAGVAGVGLLGMSLASAMILTRLKLAQEEQVRATDARFAALGRELAERIDGVEARIAEGFAQIRLSAEVADQRHADAESELQTSLTRAIGEVRESARSELSAEVERLRSESATELRDAVKGVQESAKGQFDRLGKDLAKLSEDLSKRLAGLERKSKESTDKLQAELKAARKDLAAAEKANKAQRQSAVEEISKLSKRVARERSQRILGLARRDAKQRRLERCVIILCPPRTGSTWLFDALRCHPCIDFEPGMEIIEALGIEQMNRYPHGLSGGSDADLEVELAFGRGELVPSFAAPREIRALGSSLQVGNFSIEKIHPQFFEYDADRFAERVRSLEGEGVEVRVVYRLREPRHAIRSMIAYKKRDPNWHKWLEDSDVPAFFERTLRSVGEVFDRLPGMVVDYGQQRSDPAGTLKAVYAWLWPGSDAEIQRKLAQYSVDRTSRTDRTEARQTPFFGEKTAEDSQAEEDLLSLFEQCGGILDDAEAVYQRLLHPAEAAADSAVLVDEPSVDVAPEVEVKKPSGARN